MFKLTEEQQKLLTKWEEEIYSDKKYAGAIGGRITYSFTPTSLGVVIKARDFFTKKEIDLTDYDSW